jgi:GH15 family glucan-1,4-alpha-glucosidase
MEPRTARDTGTTGTTGYRRSPYPPIADYAFLSDCDVTALIAPSGNVEWLCLPRMDSPSVFGAILDRDAGGFRFGPADVEVPAARRYLPGTMVLETSWGSPNGWAIVRDVLLMGPWHNDEERSTRHVRAPTDYDAEHILLRTVRCVNGEVQLTLDCEPVFDYGLRIGTWGYTGSGYTQVVCRADGQDVVLTLTSDMNLGFEGPRAIARTLIKEGETRFCALSWGAVAPPLDQEDAYARLVWTAHHWQHWLARGTFPDHPWRQYLERSALTLKGLTYAPTGAIIAAATTSLPETPGGERNWDYRYSWIRDSTFALWGLFTLGFDWEADDFLHFVADAASGPDDLQVMYGVGGERILEERILDHLEGYEGARPVRVGNDAYRQRQHDMWGAVLDSVYLHTKSRDHLDERIWPMLVRQVEAALENWRKPDRGIWEVRGEPQHFTSSKLMCWVAADRGARLARLRNEPEQVERWQAAADEMHADICANGLDARGVFTQYYGCLLYTSPSPRDRG